MKRISSPVILGTIVAPLFLAGCVNPFMVACHETARGKDFNYTEKAGANQVGTACTKAQYYAYPGLINKDEDKKPSVNFLGMKSEHVAATVGKQLKDLDAVLSYESRRVSDHVDWLRGLRPALEQEEVVRKEAFRRLTAAGVFAEFVKKVGKPPLGEGDTVDDALEYLFPKGPEYYSMSIFHDKTGLSLADVPYTVTYLKEAKEDGRLVPVDKFEFFEDISYDKKEFDLYDSNKYVWTDKKRGWLIVGYNISTEGQPTDNIIEYLEIYRKTSDNEVESSPAVRGFLPKGGSTISAFLIDHHKQGEIGFGSPDELWTTYLSLKDTSSVLANNALRAKLVDGIFEKPDLYIDTERPERKKPDPPVLYSSIVPFGEAVDVELWQTGTWTVPFEYDKLTVNMEVQFKPPLSVEEKESELKQIYRFIRTYKKAGDKVVIEYWQPKEEFTQRIYSVVNAFSEVIGVRPKGGVYVSAELPHYAEDLTVIDYRFGGRWYRIKDDDSDGVFELKREIAEPTGDGSGVSGYHGE